MDLFPERSGSQEGSLQRRVRRHIERHGLMTPGARVLVGVSGGVDSVVLLHLLRRWNVAPVAAHVNHRLRGAASEEDEAFVRALCDKWKVALHVEAFDTAAYGEEKGQSIQEAARALRYNAFARLAEAQALDVVAVAHHLDDQTETVLLNLLRGAGPEGLAGMPTQRPLAPGSAVRLVRPLLAARRAEIEAYARAEGLAWREDAGNRSLKYQRTVLRDVILPLLEEHFGAAATVNVARSAALVRAYVEDDLRRELTAHFEQAAQAHPAGGALDLAYLDALAPVWQRRLILEALKRWLPEAPRRGALLEAIAALHDAQPGRRVEVGEGRVWRTREALRFVPREASQPDDEATTLSPGQTVAFAGGSISLHFLDERPLRLDADAPSVAVADADRLAFPLTVRRWQPGDRFRPLGMTGTKKVSDLLTDEKAPVHRRAGTPVVLSDGEIVWLAGYRLAHHARVRPETRRFAKFTYIRRD